MIKKKILIATGGTGGHIFPAYSLSNYFIKNNYNVKLTTDKRGFDYLKDYSNLNLIKIPSSPLIRKNILTILFSALIILFSIMKSIIFLLLDRPSIVVGMGGYSSFPMCIAAFILRVKFVIYENNLIIGKANTFLLPFTDKIFVSYKDLEGIPYKYKKKVFEIGNIVREEIINLNINNKERDTSNIRILVLGGSQAARIFAEVLPIIFKKLKNLDLPIKIFQQCQKNQNKELSAFYEQAKIEYEIFNFTNKIAEYYSKANLVITRSGASVLGELINVKIPFISIPLPTSADNHQYKNAEFYLKKGYGLLLREKEIKNKLQDLIVSIHKDETLTKKILSKQGQYSDKDVFNNLNIKIDKILNEKN